jgi:Rrf2 family transcriptional regulator, cysteine metabolism repressor
MRITSRGEYGLRALLDLAEHAGKEPVPSTDIASRQQIPEPYLNHLLISLRKAGLVRSVRGPKGGHKLARPANRITVADAVIALEGTYSPVEGEARAPATDEPPAAAIVRSVWDEVEAAIGEVLASITLEDLRQRKLAEQQRIMYYI